MTEKLPDIGPRDKWARDLLSNDEESTDEELVETFITAGIDEAKAREWIRHRSDFLGTELW